MEIDGNTLIFIIVLLFLFFSNPSGDGVTSQYEYNQLQTLKDQFRREHALFQNMSSSTNFRNITGLKLSYHDIVENPELNATYPIENKDYEHWMDNENYMILPENVINEISADIWNTEENVFPPNITSTLHGHINLKSNDEYEKIPMPIPRFYEPPEDFTQNQPKGGETYPSDWAQYGELHNVTFDKGEIVIQISSADRASSNFDQKSSRFFNTQSDKWRLLNLQIDFSDNLEQEKHSMSTKAVYDVKNGRILAMPQSAKFHSLFAFPHYMTMNTNNDVVDSKYEGVKQLLNEYWNASDYVNTLSMGNFQNWYDTANYKCEFMAFLQLEPWKGYTPEQIKIIDDELTWPLGRQANLSRLPSINISSGFLYSPDCGVALKLENVSGPRYELQIRTIRLHLLFGIALFAGQIYLLLAQMHNTNTPSSVNKMSFWCFSMMNLVDGSLALIYVIASGIIVELYLPLIMSAFACFILATVFETRYLISIYASQINEQNVGIVTLLRGNANSEERTTPTVIPDEASISSSLYGRLCFTLVVSTFVILTSMSWPRDLRTIFEYACITLLNSYWIPQIIRNAIKGNEPRRRRHLEDSQGQRQNKMPLLWKFVIGTTIIRITPVIYVFTYPSNVFRHHKDIRFAVILTLWLFFQIAVLYSQDILGARWFLPQYTIPEGYSYHKGMSLNDLLEHGSSSDYCIDCAICMNDVPLYVDEVPETHKIDRNSYMVTPCSHVFHTHCLESWMSYKLQCPVCRAPLPPL